MAVDTTSPGGSSAVLRADRVIGSVSTWTEETYSSRMFRQVEFLLEELSLTLNQVDLFAVANGPGSFTGLRVGIAAIKAWSEVYGKPVVGISALEAIAAQSRASTPVLVPVLDARRGEVYYSFYRRQAEAQAPALALEGEYSVMAPAEFLADLTNRLGDTPFTIVTPTPEVLSAAPNKQLDKQNGARDPHGAISIEVVQNVLAPLIGQIAVWRTQTGNPGDSLTLDANYVRRTDAEVKWKGI